MHRAATGLGFAVALGCAAALAAQSPAATSQPPSTTSSASSTSRELNVTGCVSKSSDGQFMLTNARVEPTSGSPKSGAAASAGTTPTTTAGSGAPATAGTSGSSRATEPAGSGSAGETTWALKGGSDLEKLVGHQVQVTGRAEAHESAGTPSSTAGAGTTSPSSSGTTAAADSDAHARTLEVQSVKVIAASCI